MIAHSLGRPQPVTAIPMPQHCLRSLISCGTLKTIVFPPNEEAQEDNPIPESPVVRFLRLPMTLFTLRLFFMDFILIAKSRDRSSQQIRSRKGTAARG